VAAPWVCAESYAKGVLDMRASDRCFSAAKLFFAYGLGSVHMPFAWARPRFSCQSADAPRV
jgi:hypothetical protein